MDYNELIHRIHNKKLYFCNSEKIAKEQLSYLDMLFDYNNLRPSAQEEKQKLLKKMFAKIGENCYLETPFYANWGGKNIHMGDNVYTNFGVTFVDDTDIFIGNNVMIAPNVILSTGTHPVDIELRRKVAQFNLPITIKDNVWIGASAIIMPGVTIGENSIIGAGSIVTKDIPKNVIAVGNPCKVMREINENDRKYYHKDLIIDIK